MSEPLAERMRPHTLADYESDSPGSKRYHKDRNCPALKRSTGKITSTDEARAIDQGKTLCGWCGK